MYVLVAKIEGINRMHMHPHCYYYLGSCCSSNDSRSFRRLNSRCCILIHPTPPSYHMDRTLITGEKSPEIEQRPGLGLTRFHLKPRDRILSKSRTAAELNLRHSQSQSISHTKLERRPVSTRGERMTRHFYILGTATALPRGPPM